jgi:uncharacterized protein YggE
MRLLLVLVAVGLAACQPVAPTPQAVSQPPPAAAAAPARADLSVNAQAAPQPVPVPSGLSVVGDSTVRAEPDVAYVTTGVQTRAPTAKQAQDDNTKRMTDVLAAIKRLGVKDEDLRTSGVSLSPQYNPRTPEQIDGYVATNGVTITVQDVKRVGEVLDTAVTSGANQAGGIQFGIKDDTPLRQKALDGAVKAARARADAIAGAAGMKIAGVQSLTDVSSGAAPPPIPQPRLAAGAVAADAAAAPVPIQPGQLAITARVQVVYTLQ